MSYPKKAVKDQRSATTSKLSNPRKERLLAIQQREQLKGLIVNKFLEKYNAKNKPQYSAFVDKQVNDFIKNEKLTEDNLKRLEQRIQSFQNQPSHHNQATGAANSKGGAPQNLPPIQGSQDKADRLQGDNRSVKSQQGRPQVQQDDAVSCTSSMKPKSIYHVGDEDDEWAMILKFDQELYKKEREMDDMRHVEQMKKLRNELDRQIVEKNHLKGRDHEELQVYNKIQEKQLEIMDRRIKEKEDDKKRKILQEKMSRDKQLQEEHERKKHEKRREKEIDDLLVQRIKEELTMEQQLLKQRKQEEKSHLQKVLQENEENKRKLMLQAVEEKQADVKAQEELTRLVEKQEQDREREIKNREDRTKKFMAMMTDTVVKDQKQQIWEEEQKILKHYQDREMKEKQEDEKRRLRILQQKQEMKEFLDKQVVERNQKKQFETDLSNKQADFWKHDTNNFFENEKKKNEFIKDLNKKHAGILQAQMEENNKKNRKKQATKMTMEELLQNKQILKELAQNNEAPIKREVIN